MNVTLTPQLEVLVQQKIASGQYDNADEVLRDALLQMEELDRRREAFHAAIAIGDAQIARGEVVEWTPRLRAEIWERAKAGKQPKADVVA